MKNLGNTKNAPGLYTPACLKCDSLTQDMVFPFSCTK